MITATLFNVCIYIQVGTSKLASSVKAAETKKNPYQLAIQVYRVEILFKLNWQKTQLWSKISDWQNYSTPDIRL